MELGDIWVKVANNLRLSQQEQEFLRLEGRNTQLRNSFVAGNTSPDGKLNVVSAFEVIYSEVLQEDKASIEVMIPPAYKHVMIMGQARDSDTGHSANFIFGRFNNDAGNHYEQQKLTIAGTAVNASVSGSQPGALIGMSSNSDTSPTSRGTVFFTIIPHVHGNYQKVVLHTSGKNSAEVFTATMWTDASNIEKITFLGVIGNLLAGSALSVYGLR